MVKDADCQLTEPYCLGIKFYDELYPLTIVSKYHVGVFVICLANRALRKMFQEIYYWERLGYETPHYASEAYAKNDEQRFLRENVLLIVRDYNRLTELVS